jgi:hypothetical protein
MGKNEARRYIPSRRGMREITSFIKSQRALLLFGLIALLVMTGCSSESAVKPHQNQQVTIDSSSATHDLPQKDSTPTLNPSPAPILKTPPKRVVSDRNRPKTAPKPTTSSSPKAAQFGVPLPWEETPPAKLAAPWTSIPPTLTSTTITIVELDPHSILVAANRGLTRTAVVIPGINGYHIERGMLAGDLVDRLFVTCPNGGEIWAGWFAAVKTWNAQQHPSTYTLFPLETAEPDCSLLSNID